MKGIYLFRFFLVAIIITFFIEKFYQLNLIHDKSYYSNAFNFFNNAEMATKQLVKFKAQKILEYVLLLALVVLSKRFLFQKICATQKWHLSVLIAIVVSIIIGSSVAFLIDFFNPFYFLNTHSSPIKVTNISLFAHLIIRQTTHVFLAISLSFLVAEVERIIKPDLSKVNLSLKALDFRFWVSQYSIHFILSFIILQYALAPFKSQLLFFAPWALAASLLFCVISYIMIDAFVEKTSLDFSKPIAKFSRTILASVGILSLLYFSAELNLSFGNRWLTVTMNPIWIITGIMYLIVFISTLSCFYIFSKSVRKALAKEEKFEEQNSELTLLKSQINPHFLFNSLNTVYGLALNEESPKTAHAVQQLSEMMRFMLHENTAEKIELKKEVEYLKNFIELQKLRLDQNQNIQLDIEIDDACEGEIAPMLLIPFVENAFKHGISLKEPSWIKIRLSCADKKVHLNVHNSVHKRLDDPEIGKSGIGQENVRKRLAILYPQKHLFQLYDAEDNYEANIKIDLS